MSSDLPLPELRYAVHRWRRRPIVYGFAALLAGAPLAWLVRVATGPGADGLGIFALPFGVALGVVVLLLLAERPLSPAPAEWADVDLARSTMAIPRLPRDPPELLSVAALTVWSGWQLALLCVLVSWLAEGTLTPGSVFGTVFFGFQLTIPVLLTTFFLTNVHETYSLLQLRSPPTLVDLEGRTLRVDGARFLLGRDHEKMQVTSVPGGQCLVLTCGPDQMRIEGPASHITLLRDRLRQAPRSGNRRDVPSGLEAVASGPRISAPTQRSAISGQMSAL